MTALALPPAAPAPRRNVALAGTMFAIAAGIMLMGGLLAAYFGARQVVHHAGGTWLDTTQTPLPNVALAVTYVSLLMSSFTAQWAVSAIKMDDRRQGYVAIGLTLMLAAAFVNGLTFCWGQLGVAAGDGAFADRMYAVTAVHLLLVVVAVVYFVVMAFRVLGGQFGSRNSEFVVSAVAFWHFVVVAGVAVWWCIWFLEGGPG
jgi:heme/copper-type cytochrome/quinol oxidase subunit 3